MCTECTGLSAVPTPNHLLEQARIPLIAIHPYFLADLANPKVTSVQYSLTSEYTVSEKIEFNVTCNSEGGPATMVTWTRDGEPVSGGDFTATRRLDDPVTAAYTLTLSVSGRQGGVYRCQVAKGGPGVSGSPVHSSMELEVKGKCVFVILNSCFRECHVL